MKSNDGRPERSPAEPDYSTGQQIDKVALKQILPALARSVDDIAKVAIRYKQSKDRS